MNPIFPGNCSIFDDIMGVVAALFLIAVLIPDDLYYRLKDWWRGRRG